MGPDPDAVGRALRALASHQPADAIAALAPLSTPPRAAPLVLELLGRAHLAAQGPGDALEARKLFARARSRIEAAGDRLGILPTAADAVEALFWDNGEIVVARARERYLAGGYQSSGTHSMWIERYAPGDREPLVRQPVGNLDGIVYAPRRHTLALIDTPLDETFTSGPIPRTARLFDARTGQPRGAWPMAESRVMAAGPTPGSLLIGENGGVRVYDDSGHPGRLLSLTGTTHGTIFAYGTDGCHAIPTTFASAPQTAAAAADGTIAIGASDGAIWVWRRGAATPSVLVAWKTPAHDAAGSTARMPITMGLDASGAALTVVHGDGSIVAWDLDKRTHQTVAQGPCTPEELAATGIGAPAATPDALRECGNTRTAALSPDRSRALLAALASSTRVRDAHTGAALGILDTLESDTVAFEDDAGTHAWLGGVQGQVARWGTSASSGQTGASEFLAQGGVGGMLRSLSGDGRLLVVTDTPRGDSRSASRPDAVVWDTEQARRVPGLPGLAEAHFAAESPVMLAVRIENKKPLEELWNRSDPAHLTKTFTLDAPHEAEPRMSADATRLVSFELGGGLIVRDPGRPVRPLPASSFVPGANLSWLVVDRTAHVAAASSSSPAPSGSSGAPSMEVLAWNLEDGSILMRTAAFPVWALSLSPSGRKLAIGTPGAVRVLALPGGAEVAKLLPTDLGPKPSPEPLRGCTLTSDEEALCVVPGAPGYLRVVKWTLGGKIEPTQVQVLDGARLELLSATVAAVYDRNDTVHLLRIADGVLLASLYATDGGGWLAMTPLGAVDASPEGQAAAVTLVEGGHVLAGRSSWLAWDRFAVPGLLTRAVAGELVAPPLPGVVMKSESLAAASAP